VHEAPIRDDDNTDSFCIVGDSQRAMSTDGAHEHTASESEPGVGGELSS